MKHYFLLSLTLLCAVIIKAQTTFGIATFTVPERWQMTEQTSAVVLEKKSSDGQVCRITILATEKTAVNTADLYLQSRTSRNSDGIKYSTGVKSVARSEADGLISFSSSGTGLVNDVKVSSYFYSITNNQQSFFVQLLSSNNDCVGEFNQFLTTLLAEEATTITKAKASKRGRPKKAAPCAPAPMM
ncbi:MAG: hypothetical protein IPH18_04620 [Chitinophagaceae bacterium]|nr:hypothetical protein [Chitinophagaceae bacterium]MBK8953797.1 hypothetical protein [Chitinophagaceae bacterium]